MKTMKIILFIVLLSFLSCSKEETKPIPENNSKQNSIQTESKSVPVNDPVYICNGPGSLKYHAYSGCKGLSRCSTAIEKIDKSEAVKLGRTPCKICKPD